MISIRGKIPIRIFPVFWVLAIAIGWINSYELMATFDAMLISIAIWVVIIVISVLVHEYGHALTAIVFGQTARIDLMGMGGLTQREGKKLKLWKEFYHRLERPSFRFDTCLFGL